MPTRYFKIEGDQLEDGEEGSSEGLLTHYTRPEIQSKFSNWIKFGFTFLCGVLSTVVVLLAWKRLGHHEIDILRPPGEFQYLYKANATFAAFPSPRSDQAWRDLKPNGIGFIQHPSLGPEILSIAVFHQLHCLDALRGLIYESSFNGTDPGETPWHVGHCLEYLRNVLLCNADTNLEYTQHSLDESGAMAGFDPTKPHMCRDYRKVFNFAEKWRVFDGKSIEERRPIKDPGSRIIHYVDLQSQSGRL